MLVHQIRTASCSAEASRSFDNLLGNLPSGFRRVIYPARERLAELLGTSLSEFPPPDRQLSRRNILVAAEIITTDTHFFVIKLNFRSRSPIRPQSEPEPVTDGDDPYYLIVHSLGQQLKSEQFETLCSNLEAQFSIELRPFYYTSDQFDALKEEGRVSPPMPTANELQAAEVLSDKDTRTLAVAIKQASGLLVGDLSRQLRAEARSQIEEIRESLENSGIVTVETVVICKKTNAQVSRVPNPSALVAFAKEGLRCACGNTISDERIDTALSMSERGQWLLDGSHWFTILLVHNLVQFGVPLERILVDQVSGGDEMDCIADISGEIVLFELKDKEFNLGNAYSFGAKIGIVEPAYPVIVTTEYVGNDAKEHFARSRRRPRDTWAADEEHSDQIVLYIEGMGNFKPGLMNLIGKIAMGDTSQALTDVLPRATLPKPSVLKYLGERFLVTDEKSDSKSPKTKGRRTSDIAAKEL